MQNLHNGSKFHAISSLVGPSGWPAWIGLGDGRPTSGGRACGSFAGARAHWRGRAHVARRPRLPLGPLEGAWWPRPRGRRRRGLEDGARWAASTAGWREGAASGRDCTRQAARRKRRRLASQCKCSPNVVYHCQQLAATTTTTTSGDNNNNNNNNDSHRTRPTAAGGAWEERQQHESTSHGQNTTNDRVSKRTLARGE